MSGSIKILMDGSEWCENCNRLCDSRCKSCDLYKNRMFTKDERLNKTFYHGFKNHDQENRRCHGPSFK